MDQSWEVGTIMGKGIMLVRGWRLRYGITPASIIIRESNDT